MSVVNTLWMIGAGKMGQALYTGWVQANLPIPSITLIDPTPQPDDFLLRENDRWLADAPNDAEKPDIILVALKPQMMADTLPLYHAHLKPNTVILSIAAGVTLATLNQLLNAPQQPVIRLMPNTPAMIGKGITAGMVNAHVTDAQRAATEILFNAVGTFLWLSDEDQMHAVTALSGSGPAYVFAFIEAMTVAGIAEGLDTNTATLLARQTVIGSAALAEAQSDIPAAMLRQNVTSPGGTTAAGLNVLQGGLDDLLVHTVAAAAKRSKELAQG